MADSRYKERMKQLEARAEQQRKAHAQTQRAQTPVKTVYKSIYSELRPDKSDTSLKILQLSAYNIANIPYTLNRGINELTPHCSVCVTFIHPYCDYIQYPEEFMLGTNLTLHQLYRLIQDADVIHMHNSLHQILGHAPVHNFITDLLTHSRKVKILHAHGTYHRFYKTLVEELRSKVGFRDIMATPDVPLMNKYPGALYLPNPVDIPFYEPYKAIDNKDDVIRIAHAPTYRPSKSTHYLETVIIPTLQRKFGEDKIQFQYIFNKTNQECLQMRSQCVLNFDQILIGTYGLGAQESIAQGIIPIVRVGTKPERFLQKFFNTPSPFVLKTNEAQDVMLDKLVSTVDTGSDTPPPSETSITASTLMVPGFTEQLIEVMSRLISNPEYRESVRKEQFEWLQKTHSMPLVIDLLIQYYTQMMR